MSKNFLHREQYIRLGGMLLLASPVFNLLFSIALKSPAPRPWSPDGLMLFFRSVSWSTWVLYSASLVVGSMMLKGRRSTWAFVLVVLGAFIIMNGWTFRREAKAGILQPLSSLIINFSLFILVYIQEFHQRLYGLPPETPRSTPQAPLFFRPNRAIRVDFAGVGPWAQVISVSQSEIHMRSLGTGIPPGIHSAVVELLLPGGHIVRARLAEQKGHDFRFLCLQPAPSEVLTRWSQKAA